MPCEAVLPKRRNQKVPKQKLREFTSRPARQEMPKGVLRTEHGQEDCVMEVFGDVDGGRSSSGPRFLKYDLLSTPSTRHNS